MASQPTESSAHSVLPLVSDRVPDLLQVARSLNLLATNHEVVDLLRTEGIRTLVLKGPVLQERVFGTPAAYLSGDVDLLVRGRHFSRAREMLEAQGFTAVPELGVLWRIDRACTLERDGVRVDLHWGVHAGHVPAICFSRLEAELWATAREHPDGHWEPALEALLVYLAVHAAGHGFERDVWTETIGRVADRVDQWERVWALADRCRVRHPLEAALREIEGAPRPRALLLLDGWSGAAVWAASWVARGHFVPTSVRRWGTGIRRGYRPGELRVSFGGLDLAVGRRVFAPAPITETLVARAVERLRDEPRPVAVDVGTGSGAVAFAIARELPAAEVHAVDISRSAIRCARRNRRRLGIPVQLHRSDLLRGLTHLQGRVSVVTSNAPYVDRNQWTGTLGDWIPEHAVFGTGGDGLGLVRQLARQALGILRPGGWLVVQVAERQWETLAADLEEMGYRAVPPRERRPGRAVVGCAVAPGET